MNHPNLFLYFQKDYVEEVQMSILLLKTDLFITRGKYKTTVQEQYTQVVVPTCKYEFELPDGSYSVHHKKAGGITH